MRKRPSSRIIIIVAVGFGLVALGRLGALRPITKGLAFIGSPVMRIMSVGGSGTGNFFSFFGQIKDLNQRNIQLEKQVSELKLQLIQDADLRQQNAALKKQLGFTETVKQQLVPAEIIAFQPDNFRSYLTINRGKHDGLVNGMAVISEGALVGKLADVGDSTSKVFLLTDPDFRVAVLDQNSRATGLVHGVLGNGLQLEDVPQDQQIKPGDTLITSGLGGDLPKGLIVGQIESTSHQDNAIFQSAQVISNIKVNRLELVFVVTRP